MSKPTYHLVITIVWTAWFATMISAANPNVGIAPFGLAGIFIMVLILVYLGLCAHDRFKRWRREVKTLAAQRIKDLDEQRKALCERAEAQNLDLSIGMLNNVERRINRGIYGEHQPQKLHWPKEVA